MEAKHTPGPWELDAPDTAHVTDESYHNVRAGCGFWDASNSQREPGFSVSGHMSAADARLIAAAPDLLEALQAAQMALMGYLHQNEITLSALAKARAAIAKATGSAA